MAGVSGVGVVGLRRARRRGRGGGGACTLSVLTRGETGAARGAAAATRVLLLGRLLDVNLLRLGLGVAGVSVRPRKAGPRRCREKRHEGEEDSCGGGRYDAVAQTRAKTRSVLALHRLRPSASYRALRSTKVAPRRDGECRAHLRASDGVAYSLLAGLLVALLRGRGVVAALGLTVLGLAVAGAGRGRAVLAAGGAGVSGCREIGSEVRRGG